MPSSSPFNRTNGKIHHPRPLIRHISDAGRRLRNPEGWAGNKLFGTAILSLQLPRKKLGGSHAIRAFRRIPDRISGASSSIHRRQSCPNVSRDNIDRHGTAGTYAAVQGNGGRRRGVQGTTKATRDFRRRFFFRRWDNGIGSRKPIADRRKTIRQKSGGAGSSVKNPLGRRGLCLRRETTYWRRPSGEGCAQTTSRGYGAGPSVRCRGLHKRAGMPRGASAPAAGRLGISPEVLQRRRACAS